MIRTTIRSWLSRKTIRPKTQRRLRLEHLENRVTPSHTFKVDDDGHTFHHPDFMTIQAAVNAAHAGDHILVAPGDYRERSS